VLNRIESTEFHQQLTLSIHMSTL